MYKYMYIYIHIHYLYLNISYIYIAIQAIHKAFQTDPKTALQVKPVLQLSSSLLDGSTMDDLDDGDGEGGGSCGPVDAMIVEEAFQVCTTALSNSGRLPDNTNRRVVKWLHSAGAIDIFQTGEITLSREVVNHGLSIGNAVLERQLRDVASTLEIQTHMKDNGWRFDDLANLHSKKLLRDNPKTYYSLVFHNHEGLLYYEDEGWFHHRQIDKYYMALEAAMIHFPTEIVEIPAYKPAAFYVQLNKYLCGESKIDPRESTNEGRARTVV